MVDFVPMTLDREWFFGQDELVLFIILPFMSFRRECVARLNFTNFMPVSEAVYQTHDRWKRLHVKQATQHRFWISMSASSLALEFSGKRVSKKDSSKHTEGTHRR